MDEITGKMIGFFRLDLAHFKQYMDTIRATWDGVETGELEARARIAQDIQWACQGLENLIEMLDETYK